MLYHEFTTTCAQRLQPCSAKSRLKVGKQYELEMPGKVMRSLRLTDAGLTVPLNLDFTALGSASQVVYAATLPNCWYLTRLSARSHQQNKTSFPYQALELVTRSVTSHLLPVSSF